MVRILTDSASDLTPAEAKELNVTLIPLNITLEDGRVLRDGLDISGGEFYRHMAECGKLPMTSQPSPELFASAYTEAAEAGDEVVAVTISSCLSGTYQCAKLAGDMAEFEGLHLVDSETVCLAEALLVRRACRLRDEGFSAAEIVEALEKAKKHLHLVAVIDDLKYLRKGGRLPAAVAVAGGMLGIKPLITIREGKVHMAGKARGLPGAYVTMFKRIEEWGGVDFSTDYVAGYTASHHELEPVDRYFSMNLHQAPPAPSRIGCVIGTHAGPGAFGFAFFDALPDEA